MDALEAWRSRVRAYCAGVDDAFVAEVARRCVATTERGQTTCVWHEVYHYIRETRVRPACRICGSTAGQLNPATGAHCLCDARMARGMKTPPLVDTSRCPCAPCQAAARVGAAC